MFTRQQYLNKEVTHRQYYAQFVMPIIKDIVLQNIATKEEIREALKQDEALNTIPLQKWDWQAAQIRNLCGPQLKERGDFYSQGGAVCILKEAARQITEEEKYIAMKFDYSTIKLDMLRALPRYQVPKGNHLQQDPGNGCMLDAPGYPTYFTRSVYNAAGNDLKHGPYLVITDPDDAEKHYVVDNINIRALWLPLPLDHPRIKLWEQACYMHWQRCYHDPNGEGEGKPDTLIWPIPEYVLNGIAPAPKNIRGNEPIHWKYNVFVDGIYADKALKWGIAWEAKLPINLYNHQVYGKWQHAIQSKRPLATPDNHLVTRSIQGFYPEYHPNCNWIVNPPKEGYEPNNRWWERYAQPLVNTQEEGDQ
jgi:hypothetical protein